MSVIRMLSFCHDRTVSNLSKPCPNLDRTPTLRAKPHPDSQGHPVGFKHTCSSLSSPLSDPICSSESLKSKTSVLAMILPLVSDLGSGMNLQPDRRSP